MGGPHPGLSQNWERGIGFLHLFSFSQGYTLAGPEKVAPQRRMRAADNIVPDHILREREYNHLPPDLVGFLHHERQEHHSCQRHRRDLP